MCGDYGSYEGDSDGASTMLGSPLSVRARKDYQCAACLGDIPAGAYHSRLTWQSDGTVDTMRLHLQCRDVCDEMGWYQERILIDESDNDEEKGEEWLEHRRSLYQWAAGGEYTYGQRWTHEELDPAKRRAATLKTAVFGWDGEEGETK